MTWTLDTSGRVASQVNPDGSGQSQLASSLPTGTLTQQAPLSAYQQDQMGKMYAAYQTAIAKDVTFTTAGAVTKAFQADPQAVSNVQAMLAAYPTAVPAGFYWVSSDNTQVPFTRADLQGLAGKMGDQGWAAFQNLQNRKTSIGGATTVAAVQAVVW